MVALLQLMAPGTKASAEAPLIHSGAWQAQVPGFIAQGCAQFSQPVVIEEDQSARRDLRA